MLDFATLKRAERPNNYLVAPEGLCREATPDDIAPVFNTSLEDVKAAFLRTLATEPRIEITDESPQALECVQRSRVFRFPDLVSVRFIDVPTEKTTLAIYSRSVYGYSDMGVNSKRIQRLLTQLKKALSAE